MEKYRLMTAAFDKVADENKEYVVILYALEKSPCLAEALYQSWDLGARVNVRIIVLSSNERNVLNENLLKFNNTSDEKWNIYSHLTLYFDDETNEVMAKQSHSPEFRIQIVENSQLSDASD